ncbi:MAG TPA: hypothetical protein PKV22_00020 [Paludibacteraceae bacterium]|nr:hypothetical protein [Paludibacteraceae bacterium]HQH66333.1 hypothetical protein [Clostridia bacterium]
MLSLSENLIYEKIRNNKTPYWTLYMHDGVLRSNNPSDIFDPDTLELKDDDTRIEASIRKLQSDLEYYKKELPKGIPMYFHIVMKKTKTSNGEASVFSYNFKITNEQATALNGIEQTQQQGINGFKTPEEMDAYIQKKMEIYQKELLLGIKEEEIKKKEKELIERDNELNKESTVVARGMKNVFWQIAGELGWADNKPAAPLSGTPTNSHDTKADKVEKIANYIYDKIDEQDIELLTPELLSTLINIAKNKNNIDNQDNHK